MNPGTVSDFMGKRTAGELSASDVAKAKRRAIADVVTQYDPIAGMRMQSTLEGEDRDTELHQLRVAEVNSKLRGLEREEAHRETFSAAMRMTPDEVDAELTGNTELLSGMGMSVVRNENGTYTAKVGDDNVTLQPSQARGLAIAARLGKAGFGPEAYQMAVSVDKDLYTRATDNYNRQFDRDKHNDTMADRAEGRAIQRDQIAATNHRTDAYSASRAAGGSGKTPRTPSYKGATVDSNGKVTHSTWARQVAADANAKVKAGEMTQDEANTIIQDTNLVDTEWASVQALARAFKANPDKVQEGVKIATAKGWDPVIIRAAAQEAGVKLNPQGASSDKAEPKKLPPSRASVSDTSAANKPAERPVGNFYSQANSDTRNAERNQRAAEQKARDDAERKRRQEETDKWAAGVKNTLAARQERERNAREQ